MSFFEWLFSAQDYMPHGMCLLWQPQLIWLHVVSDGAIALSYYSIPVAMAYFAARRPDLVFRNLFILSAIFILACGTTHAFSIWTLWHPDYRVDGMIKAFTALVSVAASVALWRAMPRALALPGVGELTRELAARGKTEAQLRESNIDLEARVRERTGALESEIARQRSLFGHSMDGIVLVRLDGAITAANPAACAMLGADEAALTHMNWGALITSGGLAPLTELAGAREGNGHYRGEIEMRRADGLLLTAEIGAAKFADAGGEPQAVLILRDITERKAEEARQSRVQRIESVGQLAGGIAHDFNNLLTVVIGNLELVAEQGDDAHARAKLVSNALYAALRGAELTSRLLAYARQQPLKPQKVNINDLANSLEMMLKRTLGENINIRTKLTEGLWPCVVDQGQLENALVNLTINARDAMPKGGTIVIETSNTVLDADYAAHNAEVTPGDYVLLSVSDQGTGMSDETLARVFEPYFTTKEVGKGSGLGLSMVYGFVKQSGGHVSIYSELGHGTTVRLYLPRANAETAERPQISIDMLPQASGRKQASVLVVEDEPEVRELAVKLLRGFGLDVIEASDAAQAIAILSDDTPIDLMFTDVVLPGGVHGPELGREALQLRPGLKILYTSGYTEDAIIQHGRLRGEVKLLSKPYRKQELARRVFEVLQ